MKTSDRITKRAAVDLFGTQTSLANALGITKSAVSQWDPDGVIPEKHELRIRYELRPDAFRSEAAKPEQSPAATRDAV